MLNIATFIIRDAEHRYLYQYIKNCYFDQQRCQTSLPLSTQTLHIATFNHRHVKHRHLYHQILNTATFIQRRH
jgi:hypothetical protein